MIGQIPESLYEKILFVNCTLYCTYTNHKINTAKCLILSEIFLLYGITFHSNLLLPPSTLSPPMPPHPFVEIYYLCPHIMHFSHSFHSTTILAPPTYILAYLAQLPFTFYPCISDQPHLLYPLHSTWAHLLCPVDTGSALKHLSTLQTLCHCQCLCFHFSSKSNKLFYCAFTTNHHPFFPFNWPTCFSTGNLDAIFPLFLLFAPPPC